MSETNAESAREVGIRKCSDGSVAARVQRAMSKKAVHAWGLETSACGVPRSLVNVPGHVVETVVSNPRYPALSHASLVQGERTAVGPLSSRFASQCEVVGGTPKRHQLATTASLDTESNTRRMFLLDVGVAGGVGVAGMFDTVKVDDEGGVGAVPPAKPVLAGGQCEMHIP